MASFSCQPARSYTCRTKSRVPVPSEYTLSPRIQTRCGENWRTSAAYQPRIRRVWSFTTARPSREAYGWWQDHTATFERSAALSSSNTTSPDIAGRTS